MNQTEFFFFVSSKKNQFCVYDQATSSLLATVNSPESGSGLSCLDLPPLSLSEGLHTLGVEYIDPYGTASKRVTIPVEIDAMGNPIIPIRGLLGVESKPLANGRIRLRWAAAVKDTAYADPDEYQVALASDPSTVIHNESFTGGESYTIELGPFTHGQTVELMVRPALGASVGAWVSAEPVVADAVGPAPPVLLL